MNPQEAADSLARLMEEFGLEQAKWKADEWTVEFDRRPEKARAPIAMVAGEAHSEQLEEEFEPYETPVSAGRKVESPTTGVFYAAPSPGSPPFVKEGEDVAAGQVIGLIEAMKVFNEVTTPFSGKVLKVVAQSGQLVYPGDALLMLEDAV
ncbi:MAG: hypothetical protein KIT11_00370 [Fimbriimonadaceae bacterium]|nr:hypothetical protein [Fimbriimonadaceae bacterium]QYK55173.1 MAG: hypothetical protein KF733_09165 [Fimbriimonadaceae bacterium]